MMLRCVPQLMYATSLSYFSSDSAVAQFMMPEGRVLPDRRRSGFSHHRFPATVDETFGAASTLSLVVAEATASVSVVSDDFPMAGFSMLNIPNLVICRIDRRDIVICGFLSVYGLAHPFAVLVRVE
ncbi:MAG: hypothetical protein NTW86_23405 [Candidatus Sumerlaeota bacterium]|nr:hypothetical protein [Candidatus Sumerlaeota bacterium]